MNKKIAIMAAISFFLQLLILVLAFEKIHIHHFLLVLTLYLLIAVPYGIYLAFQKIKFQPRQHKILNFIGLFFILPSLLGGLILFREMTYTYPETPVEIEPAAINVIKQNENKVPLDSFRITIEKDANNQDVIKFKRKE